MRADTTAEDGGYGETAAATESASGGRRASIATLQNMLKKVSQSPVHNQYKTLVSSASDSSFSSADYSHNKQGGGQELHHESPQNGVNGGLTRTNPFYNYLEKNNSDYAVKDPGRETSERVILDTVFDPPPEFKSTPQDLQPAIKTLANGDKLDERDDLFHSLTNNHKDAIFQASTVGQNINGYLHDVTLNSPDLYKANLSKSLLSENSDLLKNEADGRFQAAKGENVLAAAWAKEVNSFDHSSSVFADPFKSPSVFQSPQPWGANPFYTATPNGQLKENEQDPSTKEGLLAKENLDIFSSSSLNSVDPFPSPLRRDLFQDISSLDEPFGSPSKQNNPFSDVSNGAADISQPLPSKTPNKDIFAVTPNNTASKALYSTLSFNSPLDLKLDMQSSPDVLKATPSESFSATQPESFNGPHDVVLTTPQGSKHDVLQPTPFTRARNLAMLPMHSPSEMSHVPTIRRPPKPLPRTRPSRTQKPPTPEVSPKPEVPPRPEVPPKPEMSTTPSKLVEPEQVVPKTSPKPSLRRLMKPLNTLKTKPQEIKPVNPDNYVVFEDILLTGQERCVEDWPEDSPQLNPGFKPSGKLRLRRESLKLIMDSDGGSGDDQDGSGSQIKKKDKRSIKSRRGSKKMDSDGGSGEDQDGSGSLSKKKDRRRSILSIKSPKDKLSDDVKVGRSRTLSSPRNSSKEYFAESHMLTGEDGDQDGMDYKKKPVKTKSNSLLRRSSTPSNVHEEKNMNGNLPEESKEDGIDKKSVGKKNSIRRWSEGTILDKSSGEEEDGEATHEEKKKKKVKIKFVPHRGFAITLQPEAEPKGAHGYTRRRSSKDKSQDDACGAHGYTARKKSQDDAVEDVEEMKAYSLQSTSKAAFMDTEDFRKTGFSPGQDEEVFGIEDYKPKKQTKMKLSIGRRSSKEDMLDESSAWKKKSSLSAEELDDDELYGMEDGKMKNVKHKGPVPVPRKSQTSFTTAGQSESVGFSYYKPQQATNDEINGKDFMSTEEMFDNDRRGLETKKPKKLLKLKGFKRQKVKNKAMYLESEDPPGATSIDYLSDAAKAEWLAAQKDEQAMAGSDEDSDAGDTDSLMEWWYTVEQWDEVPSDEEDKIMKEDESKSFTILADKVHRGLRVFHKVFTERAEVLWQSVITLHAIAEDISKFHSKARIAGITGGTTTAVGGVTAIAGLALAPFTFGASLVVTAVGVGVATAGGIASASAAISDNVNNMHDRKKVETVLQEYETYLLDIGKILHFVSQGLYKLRGHPFLRSGTQHYSQDWEIRRAVQMIGLVDTPVVRATEITDAAVASVQGLFKGIDKYFIKDSRELKKGCKKEMVAQIKEVANVLNESVMELNTIREELQDAAGDM